MPAANTATPALVLPIRLKIGSKSAGNLYPVKTIKTAKIGDQQTGSLSALKSALPAPGRGSGSLMAEPADAVPVPSFFRSAVSAAACRAGLSKNRAIGITMAFTTMATTATTRPTVALVPKIGSRTANPRYPIVGAPATKHRQSSRCLYNLQAYNFVAIKEHFFATNNWTYPKY